MVNGAGLGRVRWVQKHEDKTTAKRNGSSTVEEQPAQREALSLDEKRERYDRRRRQLVIEAVNSKLFDLKTENDRSKVLDIEGGSGFFDNELLARTLVLLNGLLKDTGWTNHVSDKMVEPPKDLSWDNLDSFKGLKLDKVIARKHVLDLCWHLTRLSLSTLFKRLMVAPGERSNELHYAVTCPHYLDSCQGEVSSGL